LLINIGGHRLAKVQSSGKTLPEYFRQINQQVQVELEANGWEGDEDAIVLALDAVLKSNLLYAGSEHEAGGRYPEYFFCATVDDDDLPWDRTQTDW
jgi:hypothetical protein